MSAKKRSGSIKNALISIASETSHPKAVENLGTRPGRDEVRADGRSPRARAAHSRFSTSLDGLATIATTRNSIVS